MAKDESNGLFHCGRCGGFFTAKIGLAAIRRCPDCGSDPTLALDDRKVRKLEAGENIVRNMAANPEAGASAEDKGGARQPRRKRKADPIARRLAIFLVLWIGGLGVFAAAKMTLNQRREREEQERAAAYRAGRPAEDHPLDQHLTAADGKFIQDAYPECRRTLFGFLQSSSPETRSAWVHDPLDMLGRMASFGDTTPTFTADQMPASEYLGLLDTPDGKLIESLWETPDGRRIEAIFRRGDEGWRLDWESFVRYSEIPWVMFLAGGGGSEGEFRLLARERLAEERKFKPTLSIVFHPPRFGSPDGVGPASPAFSVSRLSKPGRKLEALLALARAGKAPYDARVPSQDPGGMIRVRVKVRRENREGLGRTFSIDEVLAGHWLGIEDGGIPSDQDPVPAPEPDEPQ